MLASLLAFGAAPAGAAIDTSDTCTSTIPDAGFTDLAGVPAAAVDAINCIAYFEISTGTTATTFDPFAVVQRWQMALFLTRQAEIHSVTLPDGSDQGFTDLGGVPAAAVTAINQTAQLGISTGTSATTFDPFGDVERWQMALFLTRLIDAAGITLPAGADQGFTDLAGVPAAAVTAINQLAELDIADGTTATTFDPFADVERWAMALFLARTLAADGIEGPSESGVDATGLALIDQSDDTVDPVRTYTFSGLESGVDYDVALYPCDYYEEHPVLLGNQPVLSQNGTMNSGSATFLDWYGEDLVPDYEGSTFTGDADILTINFTTYNSQEVNDVNPNSSGELIVRVGTQTPASDADCAFPVLWTDDSDADNDDDLDLEGGAHYTAPVEEFVMGGPTVFHQGEGSNGDSIDEYTMFVDADDKFFVAEDGFFYTFGRTGDFYYYEGAEVELPTSEAVFAEYLSIGDYVETEDPDLNVAPYSTTGPTLFNITNDYVSPLATGIELTTGDLDGDDDGDDFMVEWTQPADERGNIDEWSAYVRNVDTMVNTFVCGTGEGNTLGNNSDSDCQGDDLGLADGDYILWVEADSETDDGGYPSQSVEVTIDTSENVAPTVTETNLVDDTTEVAFLDTGDEFEHMFSEDMADTLGSSNATFLRVADGNSTYQIACVDEATCVLDDLEDDGADTNGVADDHLVITLTADPIFVSGTDDGIDLTEVVSVVFVSAAFDDESGNQLDAAGSADLTID